MSEKEFWRNIPDYKNYEASNTAKIRNIKTGYLLNKIIYQNNKRIKVRLSKNGYSKGFYVDYLIALFFPMNGGSSKYNKLCMSYKWWCNI